LTPEEFQIVKQHTVSGAHIVEPLRSIRNVIPLVRSHHERCDGEGYPDRLRGEAIPLEVRVLSVADVYDSLATARPYRSAIPHDRCLEMLREDAAGGGLDPELVKRFCEIVSGGPPGSRPAASATRAFMPLEGPAPIRTKNGARTSPAVASL